MKKNLLILSVATILCLFTSKASAQVAIQQGQQLSGSGNLIGTVVEVLKINMNYGYNFYDLIAVVYVPGMGYYNITLRGQVMRKVGDKIEFVFLYNSTPSYVFYHEI